MTKKRADRQRPSRPPTRQERQALVQRKQAEQNRIIMIAAGVLLVVLVALGLWQLLGNRPDEAPIVDSGERPLAAMEPAARNGFYTAAPEMVIDTANEYEAVIQTSRGEMRLRLFDDEAPVTVNNFVYLARQGFYDDTVFHRVLPGFMAQGGDPTATGSGGPGYQFEDETDNGLAFDRSGLLAMANAGPNTNGSQFFITFAEPAHLNGAHTIFGELVEGEEVLSSITLIDPSGQQAPADATPDVIERIDIVETAGQ